MTAEEIRKHSDEIFQAIGQSLAKNHDPVSCDISVKVHQFQILSEIAVQLYELNKSTERIASALEGLERK